MKLKAGLIVLASVGLLLPVGAPTAHAATRTQQLTTNPEETTWDLVPLLWQEYGWFTQNGDD